MLRRIPFVAALLFFIFGCTRQEMPQGSISPVSSHYERAMLLCEEGRYAEAMPQMEDNEAVRSQWQYLESRQHRRHRCYRKTL